MKNYKLTINFTKNGEQETKELEFSSESSSESWEYLAKAMFMFGFESDTTDISVNVEEIVKGQK